jgi:hypothetical protein
MKIGKFQLHRNNSVCAGAFRYRAAAHPRSLEGTLVDTCEFTTKIHVANNMKFVFEVLWRMVCF